MVNKNNVFVLADLKAFEDESEEDQGFIKENVHHIFNAETFGVETFSEQNRVYLYVNDQKLKELLPKLADQGCEIGFLPHPDASQTRSGYRVAGDLKEAFEQLNEVEEAQETGLLMCNEELVLNYVVIGEIVTFLTKKASSRNWIFRLKRFFRYLKRLKQIHARPFTFKAGEKDSVDTAATDILIVQYAHNSVVSRVFASEKVSSNRLFHTFIFTPRSILQLVRSYLMKMLLGAGQKSTAIHFLSRLKTEDLVISSSQKFKFNVDGNYRSTEELNFCIKGTFKQIPSQEIEFDIEEKSASDAQIFQTKHLPKGNLIKEMVRKRLPFISHASSDEYKELFTQIRENAKPSQNYVILMILSVILATLGVFANSSPVIIGAMILAPLMAPIISFSMGVLRQDRRLMKNSFITILVGIGAGYLFAIILAIITPINQMNAEITSRIEPNIIDLGVAVISGAAGAYAYSKEEIAKTLAGVAIAVALVPPLAVSGIGVAWLDFDVFFGAFLLLITNLTGMVLAAALVFLLTGYSPFRLARKGLLISLFVVLAISIPLGYGFFNVVEENNIIRSLNEKSVRGITLERVVVESRNPMVISLDIVTHQLPSNVEVDAIKKEIEERLGEEVKLKAAIRIER